MLLNKRLLLFTCLVAVVRCKHLQFRDDGTFLISQFTDLHYGEDEFTPWGPIQDKNSNHVMHVVLRMEHPDFVLFTGDTLTGNNINSNATEYWKYVLSPCLDLEAETPWAHVFGNHDDLAQSHGDRNYLMSYDMTYNMSYSQMGPSSIPGVSNYFIPIYGASDMVKGLIYVMDSGGGNIPIQLTSAHISWLISTYSLNLQIYGHVPSILAFHIPIPEFQTLYNSGGCVGDLNNTIENMPNSNVFDTIMVLSDILLVTTGHYHENDFCCPINHGDNKPSKLLCQGRHSGYGGYSNQPRGSRLIHFTETGLETWIRMEDGSKIHYLKIEYGSRFMK